MAIADLACARVHECVGCHIPFGVIISKHRRELLTLDVKTTLSKFTATPSDRDVKKSNPSHACI